MILNRHRVFDAVILNANKIKPKEDYKAMDAKKIRPFNLRKRTPEELNQLLDEYRKELGVLRINKLTSAVGSRIAKISLVRKGVARILTTINQKRRQEFRKVFTSPAEIRKFNDEYKTSYTSSRIPKQLRPRKTRALRRALTKHQSHKKLVKIIKRERAFPQRKFFVKS